MRKEEQRDETWIRNLISVLPTPKARDQIRHILVQVKLRCYTLATVGHGDLQLSDVLCNAIDRK